MRLSCFSFRGECPSWCAVGCKRQWWGWWRHPWWDICTRNSQSGTNTVLVLIFRQERAPSKDRLTSPCPLKEALGRATGSAFRWLRYRGQYRNPRDCFSRNHIWQFHPKRHQLRLKKARNCIKYSRSDHYVHLSPLGKVQLPSRDLRIFVCRHTRKSILCRSQEAILTPRSTHCLSFHFACALGAKFHQILKHSPLFFVSDSYF